MENAKHQTSSAKYYDNKIKNDAEFYAQEKKRVNNYMKNRYAIDEEYRNRIKEQKKQSYHKRKALRNQSNPIEVN